jgi:hypothetical protein
MNGLLAACVSPAFGWLGLRGKKRNLHSLKMVYLTVALLIGALYLQSCGGKLPGETAPETY